MEHIAEKYTHINGWGIDADPVNEPTYPIKNYTGDDHNRLNYERPALQQPEDEILISNERPTLPAVFGVSPVPSGLSGMLRRYAFKHGESTYRHWLSLILADRINMVEGVFTDLRHGHIPNYFAERGLKSEWKYNRKSMVKKAAVGLIFASAITAGLLFAQRKNRR